MARNRSTPWLGTALALAVLAALVHAALPAPMLAALASSWLEAAAPTVEVAPLPIAVGACGTAALVETRDDIEVVCRAQAQRTQVPRAPPLPTQRYCIVL